MVGLAVDITQINATAGDIARTLQHTMNRVGEFKRWLDAYASADLVGQFGFSQGDADVLKSAFGEADVVRQAHTNNRTFLSRLGGLGDV